MSQCLRFLYKTNFWNIQTIAIIIMRCVYYNPCTTTFEWAVLVITYSIRYTQFKTLVLQHPTTLLRHVKQHQPWYKTCMTEIKRISFPECFSISSCCKNCCMKEPTITTLSSFPLYKYQKYARTWFYRARLGAY